MNTLYKCCINLKPRTKKNSMRIVYNERLKRPMVLPSEVYKEYEESCGWFIKRTIAPINKPVEVECHFYMETKRRVDLTNLLEAIDDILVKYNILSDDNSNVIVSHDGSRVHYDKVHPRTEIIIRGIENDCNERENGL